MKRTCSFLAMLIVVFALQIDAADNKFIAHLSGGDEVPPVQTLATGEATFKLSKDGTQLSFKLVVANIDNVVAAHIHLAPVGSDGPIVVGIFGNAPAGGGRFSGVLNEGIITAADLVGPLESSTSLEPLIEAILAGNTYVNVHTSDGVGDNDTGPGDFASGEIRGQIE